MPRTWQACVWLGPQRWWKDIGCPFCCETTRPHADRTVTYIYNIYIYVYIDCMILSYIYNYTQIQRVRQLKPLGSHGIPCTWPPTSLQIFTKWHSMKCHHCKALGYMGKLHGFDLWSTESLDAKAQGHHWVPAKWCLYFVCSCAYILQIRWYRRTNMAFAAWCTVVSVLSMD